MGQFQPIRQFNLVCGRPPIKCTLPSQCTSLLTSRTEGPDPASMQLPSGVAVATAAADGGTGLASLASSSSTSPCCSAHSRQEVGKQQAWGELCWGAWSSSWAGAGSMGLGLPAPRGVAGVWSLGGQCVDVKTPQPIPHHGAQPPPPVVVTAAGRDPWGAHSLHGCCHPAASSSGQSCI